MAITVRPLSPADREGWAALYSGYADFYEVLQTPEMRATIWSWLNDSSHELEGFVATNEAGELIGLAHYRPFSRPLSATVGGFLDDLFVSPAARGQEVSKKLIAAVAQVGRERKWSVIRWLTAEDNYRARSSYDKIATRTNFLTYDLKLEAAA